MSKNKEKVVYEDELVMAFIPQKPACNGHIRIYPKKEYDDLESMGDEIVEHIFYVASYAATALFELLGAHGTNIIAQSGELDGNPGFYVDIIARSMEDGLDFTWKPKQIPAPEMDDVAKSISDNTGVPAQATDKKEVQDMRVVEDEKVDEESYRLKQLNRIP